MASSYIARMIRASKLEPALYEEVEADRNANVQAAGVVVLASVAAGIGSIYHAGGQGFILAAIGALIGWFIWAALVYFIGAKMMPEPQTDASIAQLLRTTGFSSAPGIVRVVGIVPGIGFFFMWIGNIWMLVAMIIAVRQALDYKSTWRAIGVCFLGWVVEIVIIFVIGGIAGGAGVFTPQAHTIM